MAWAETQRAKPRQYRHATTTRRQPVTIACDACGKEYLEHQSRIERFARHYCSRECRYSGMRGVKQSEESRQKRSEALSGENAPTWKGGVSRQFRRGYKSEQYKRWRTSVFERDAYTCQGCGQVGGYLTAHHIKPFAQHAELRYATDNGVTLCEPCHALKDRYFARTHPAARVGG